MSIMDRRLGLHLHLSILEPQSSMDRTRGCRALWSTDWTLPVNYDTCISMSFGDAPSHLLRSDKHTVMQSVKQHLIQGFWIAQSLFFSYNHQVGSNSAEFVPEITFPCFTGFISYIYIQLRHQNCTHWSDQGSGLTRTYAKKIHESGPWRLKNAKERITGLNLYSLEMPRIRGELFPMFILFSSGLQKQFFALES